MLRLKQSGPRLRDCPLALNCLPQTALLPRPRGTACKTILPPTNQGGVSLKWLQDSRPRQNLAWQLCRGLFQLRQLEQSLHHRLQAAGRGQHLPSQLAARLFGQFVLQSKAHRGERVFQRAPLCTQMALNVLLAFDRQPQGGDPQRQLILFAQHLHRHRFFALAEGLAIVVQLAQALQHAKRDGHALGPHAVFVAEAGRRAGYQE